MNILTDEDPMPFGKHKDKPMKDVPARYFHWLWHNGLSTSDPNSDVARYIKDNWQALTDQTKDLIWDE